MTYRERAARSCEEWRRRYENRAIATVVCVLFGLMLGFLFMAPLEAYGASLPYVDDVNEWDGGKCCLTVTCCGKAKTELKVTDLKNGKRIRVEKHRARVWTCVIRKHRAYKLQVRDGKRWQTIRYRIG